MSVYKPAKSPYYAYDFQRGGKRYSGSTRATSERAAKAVEKHLIAEAERTLKVVGGPAAMSLLEAADRYYAEVASHGFDPKTAGEVLGRMTRLVGKDLPLTAVTDEVVARAVAARRAEHRYGDPSKGLVLPSTVNRTLTQPLQRVLTRAKKVWRIPLPQEPIWGDHLLREPKERVRELRYDEEEKLEAAEREDYRAPRLFAQITGLRRREVAGLTWYQVDFAAEVIRVVGKGDKPHVLPITPELRAILAPLQGHHPEAVFTYRASKTRDCKRLGRRVVRGERLPIHPEGFKRAMRAALDKAGIKGMRAVHDLRHTAATRTLRATGNLRLVQKLLNHSSPSITAKYAHADLGDIREGMAKAAEDTARRRESRKKPQTGEEVEV
ncbi:site-specific integrase [Methylobacterium ajmalii]|jgi:integrase|uniref:tyrosine-type recombinase/integrase n=1 Tax=Methylobacterium ajmalii TaxID=2738439 RepID=UPI001909AC53|nr:site-specific integrase [Methylobacterium ajmalii]MBK3400393.1 site-specific integrase [Methylobacterium ajmalii]MBK3407565.1 site-specific integrase [Methylobacterium ajmalii]MBK3422086.1 site-specific integrase [Methylobacterium ajmalii]MBZ6415644.1 site-specific integrase [Methylobacterium sp.]